MILTCPQCATRYGVDAARFPPQGRSVRCAKCGHVWFQTSVSSGNESIARAGEAAVAANPSDEPGAGDPVGVKRAVLGDQPSEPVEPLPEAPTPAAAAGHPKFAPGTIETHPTADNLPPSKGRRRGSAFVAAGWVALGFAVVVIAWAGFHFRREVATRWPQSASLYRQLGIHVRPRGIELVGVRNRLETEDGVHVLVVSGTLLNDSNRELAVPQIRVALSDAQRRELYQWPIVPRVPALKPGHTAPFQAKLANPPRGAEDIEVTFYGADE